MKTLSFVFKMTLACAMLLLSACSVAILQNRSDMPIRGNRVVAYNITQPESSPDNKNVQNKATLTGLGDDGAYSPYALVTTEFFQQPGLKRQVVSIGGDQMLGMTKPERGMGFSRFAKVEPASICGHDALKKAYCGLKVRVRFNRNLIQQVWSPEDKWDFDAVWYYNVPAEWNGGDNYTMHNDEASLLSISLTGIQQLRLGWGPSMFFNMNEGVVVIGGKPTFMKQGWWRETEDIPGGYNDIMDGARLVSAMVNDLETSPTRWLDFNPQGQFADSWVKYAIGDADTYATAERLFLNRQKEYAVGYRKTRADPFKFVLIEPRYNFEFNDLNNYIPDSTVSTLIDNNGKIKKDMNSIGVSNLKEFERVGCQNCPNPALEQVLFLDAETGRQLYSFTFRAYHGANDTLLIAGPEMMPWANVVAQAPKPGKADRPIKVDENGKALPDDKQPFANQQEFDNFLSEATIWNWLTKNNPARAELFMQFRVNDQTEWAPIPCSDGGICGYTAVRWNLTSSYFLDGNTHRPWLLSQLFGESGVRTLGFSFVSGRFEGFGGNFALAQDEFYNEYYNGFNNQESIFMFDARALTTPQTLDEAWAALYGNTDTGK